METIFLLAYAAFLIPTVSYLVYLYMKPEHSLHYGRNWTNLSKHNRAVINEKNCAKLEVSVLMVILFLMTCLYLWMVTVTF